MSNERKARTWVLVTDASHAKIYVMGEPGEAPSLVREIDHRAAREQGRDLLGNRPNEIQHHQESGGRPRRSPDSVQDSERERFARELAELLERARGEHQFDELVLSAPPQMLGELKGQLGKPVMGCVVKVDSKRRVDQRPEALVDELLGPA